MKIAVLSMTSGVIPRGVEAWVMELTKRLEKNNEVKVYEADEVIGAVVKMEKGSLLLVGDLLKK